MDKINLLSVLKGLVKSELGEVTSNGTYISYDSGVVANKVTSHTYNVAAGYNTLNPNVISCVFSTAQGAKNMIFVRGQERFDLILKIMETCQDKQI